MEITIWTQEHFQKSLQIHFSTVLDGILKVKFIKLYCMSVRLITTQAFIRFRQRPLNIVCIYKNHVTVKSSCQLCHLTNNSGTLKILS